MASITRDHFSEARGVTKKRLQKGVHLVDADWNEQADAFDRRMERELSALVKYESRRIGDGFKVVGTGASLQVTITAGSVVAHLASGRARLLRLESDHTLGGFSAFGSLRTDHVYLDIAETEVGTAVDPDLVNPDLGKETCVDIRLSYTFAISNGGAPGSPPSGHTYVSLATVTSASNTIAIGAVANLLIDHHEPIREVLSGQNLIRNGSFELSDAELNPTSWQNVIAGGYRDTDYVKGGNSALKMRGGGTGYQHEQYQDIPDYLLYAGKTVRLLIWVACDGNSGGTKTATIMINDGASASSLQGVQLPVTAGVFQFLELEHQVSASPTQLRVRITSGASVATWWMWADCVALFVGKAPRVFEPHPDDLVSVARADIGARLDGVETILYSSASVSHSSADALSLDNAASRFTVLAAGGSTDKIVIRLPYWHCPQYAKIILRCQLHMESGNAAEVFLANGAGSVNLVFGDTTATWHELELDVSGLASGDTTDLTVTLRSVVDTKSVYMQRVMIVAKLS